MSTAQVALDTSQYVRVNVEQRKSILLQAHRDAVRLVFADAKPAKSNPTFHILTADDHPLKLEYIDTNVWALATSLHSSLIVTEFTDGRAPVGIRDITDQAGNVARNTITQQQLVGYPDDDINVQFQYNVPYNEDSADVNGNIAGTGSIGHEGSRAFVSTGTGVGSAYIRSKDSVRYFPGHEFAAEMTAYTIDDAVTGTANTYARWGIGDPEGAGDAMAFGKIDGQFGIIFRRDGVEEFIPQSEFSHDTLDGSGPSGFILDKNALNLWTFRGGWYGILPLQWGVFTNEAGYIKCHEISPANTQQTTHLANPTIPMFIEVGRTSGTGDDVTVHSASWRGGIVGPRPINTTADRTQVQTVSEKAVSAGVRTPIITLRNATTFQGKQNHVRVRYGTVALSVEGTKAVTWEVWKNGTLTGAAFTPKNPNTSVVSYDVSATAFTPAVGSSPIGGTIMGKVDTTRINLFQGDVTLPVYPGETITLTARSANGTTVSLFFRWIEEF